MIPRAAILLLLAQTRLGVGAPSLSQEEPLTILDEGVRVGRASKINCSGAGVSCTVVGGTATMSIAGGGGGGGSSCGVRVALDLGSSGGLIYQASVSGVACVTSATRIACAPYCAGDAGTTPETCRAAGLQASVSETDGGAFLLSVESPRGATGVYQFDCVAGDQ